MGPPPALRALILCTRYPDGERPNLGLFVERQMIELARRPGVAVEIVAPCAREAGPLSLLFPPAQRDAPSPLEARKGLRVHRPVYAVLPRLSWLRPHLLARRLLPVLRAIRADFPFDLISAEFAWPEGPAAVRLGQALGVPVSIKARGPDFEQPAARALLRRQLLSAGRKAAGLLAVSEEVKAAMVAIGLPADVIGLHYPAVDAERFRIGDRIAAKQALKVDGPLLVTVGNLAARKRPALAVEALAHLPGATLILAGSGPEEARLKALAATLGVAGRLRFLGSVPHALMPAVYQAADVLIHCAESEGFPNVRLEAMACGVPLVTTAAGEASKLVRSPAQGCIVPPDPVAIAAAAAGIIANPPPRALLREVALEFSWVRATDQLEAHFRGLAGRIRVGSWESRR